MLASSKWDANAKFQCDKELANQIRPITLSDGRSWKEMQIPIVIDLDIA
jgi:hypothetical protein